MLKSIQARAYRNLDLNAPLSLEDLNVLIGANGAGKSNLLEMIEFLPDAVVLGLPESFKKRRSSTSVANVDRGFPCEMHLCWQFSGEPDLTQGIDIKYEINLEIEDRGTFSVTHELMEEVEPRRKGASENYKHLAFEYGRGSATPYEKKRPKGLKYVVEQHDDLKSAQRLALGALSSPTIYPVLDYIRGQVQHWSFYNANDMDIRAIKREPIEIDALQRTLESNGRNLVMVLYNLYHTDNYFQENLDRILLAMYSGHRRISFPLIDSRHFELRWGFKSHHKDLMFDQISDGTARMLCWVVVLTSSAPPDLICIDEPELGIHPAWLPILADLIKDAATRTQVIVTTHSPELLDEFTEEAGKVVVCSEDEQGHATFERKDREELLEWLERYRLGQMFRSGHPELGGWPK
jgi:predicted ATPase